MFFANAQSQAELRFAQLQAEHRTKLRKNSLWQMKFFIFLWIDQEIYHRKPPEA